MRILIQKEVNKSFYIDIGWKTKLFQSMWFITWGKEWYENGVVEYATIDGYFLKHPKYWKFERASALFDGIILGLVIVGAIWAFAYICNHILK